MVFPHHGGRSAEYDVVAFTATLCKLTKPSTVIFSIGRNKHFNPRPEVVQTVRSIIPDVRIACTQLSRNCANDLPKNKLKHLLSFFAKGKANRECCAGTFIIKLGNVIEYLTNKVSHQSYH